MRPSLRRSLAVLVAGIALSAIAGVARAVLVSPLAIFMDARARTAEITLANTTATPEEVTGMKTPPVVRMTVGSVSVIRTCFPRSPRNSSTPLLGVAASTGFDSPGNTAPKSSARSGTTVIGV